MAGDFWNENEKYACIKGRKVPHIGAKMLRMRIKKGHNNTNISLHSTGRHNICQCGGIPFQGFNSLVKLHQPSGGLACGVD